MCHDTLSFQRIVVIETHEHAGDFKECSSPVTCEAPSIIKREQGD